MKSPHQYRQRTYDEALELARVRFSEEAAEHLSPDEIEEFRTKGTISGGTFADDWTADIGVEPEKNQYYEIQVYQPAEECPYITRYFARVLVSRDRRSEGVWIKWKPPVPEYNGPQFT